MPKYLEIYFYEYFKCRTYLQSSNLNGKMYSDGFNVAGIHVNPMALKFFVGVMQC